MLNPLLSVPMREGIIACSALAFGGGMLLGYVLTHPVIQLPPSVFPILDIFEHRSILMAGLIVLQLPNTVIVAFLSSLLIKRTSRKRAFLLGVFLYPLYLCAGWPLFSWMAAKGLERGLVTINAATLLWPYFVETMILTATTYILFLGTLYVFERLLLRMAR